MNDVGVAAEPRLGMRRLALELADGGLHLLRFEEGDAAAGEHDLQRADDEAADDERRDRLDARPQKLNVDEVETADRRSARSR